MDIIIAETPKFEIWPLSRQKGKFLINMRRHKRNSYGDIKDDYEWVTLSTPDGKEIAFSKEEAYALINEYKEYYRQLKYLNKDKKLRKSNPEKDFPHIWALGGIKS